MLAEAGLCSAYHHIQKEAQGEESIPTFFLHRHADRPYHIDYAFASPERIRHCYIETSANWLAISDHRPLILEIEELPHAKKPGNGGKAV
jgi:endonuclease/exonuclease/phosphatase family metal-dependent hydrolase